MISLTFHRLLAIFLILDIGESKCEASWRKSFLNKLILMLRNISNGKYSDCETLYANRTSQKTTLLSTKWCLTKKESQITSPRHFTFKIQKCLCYKLLCVFQSSRDGIFSFQIESILSTVLGKIEKIDKRLKVSEDMYKNLTDTVSSLRLKVNEHHHVSDSFVSDSFFGIDFMETKIFDRD